ncbi:MAG: amidohydrolase family protein [Candidatus Cloacimonetes bacterium]|nr:amidohydrolase family protein [Candidatus Cloacimonadota bacterium]
MNLEIIGGYVVIPNENAISVEEKNIFIKDGIVFYEKPFDKSDKIINAKNKIIFPGLVNAHHHIYSCLSKGIPAEVPFVDFEGTLAKLWWKLDRALLKDDMILSTALVMQDCLKNGVTTVFDHHISASFIKNSLSTMAKVFDDYGVSGSIAFEMSDRNGEDVFLESLEENVNFAKQNKNSDVKGMIGLHAAFTLSNESLKKISDKSEKFPIHVHIAEGNIDEIQSQEKYGKSIIERLDDFGLLRDNSLMVHCSNISEKEIEILKEKNIFIAQTIDSNLNNALNVANISDLINSDLKVTVGTDGMTSNIMKAYKNSYIFTKYLNKTPDIGFPEMHELFMNSYRLKKAFGLPLGVLENENADIAIFDYEPATPLNTDTFLGLFIFGITESQAQWVIKNDKVLLDDYKLKTTDKYNDLINNAIEISKKMFDRFLEI